MSARTSLIFPATIAPGDSKSFSAQGNSFYVLSLPSVCHISTDLTGAKPYKRSTGEDFEFEFSRLTIENRTNFEQSILLWYGFGEYKNDTAEVLEGFTLGKGSNNGQIPGKTGLLLTGGSVGKMRQRRAMYVSNLDLANDIYVRDPAGGVICAVFPRTAITVPISGPVEVYNPNTPAIACYIGETWYADQF